MARIFVFEHTDLDISQLWKRGDVTYVFASGESRRALRDDNLEEQIISQLTRFNFDPEKDYLALVGSQLSLVILTTAAVSLYGEIKTLAFDSVSRGYYERKIGSLSEQEFIEVA